MSTERSDGEYVKQLAEKHNGHLKELFDGSLKHGKSTFVIIEAAIKEAMEHQREKDRDVTRLFGHTVDEIIQFINEAKMHRAHPDQPVIPLSIAELALREQSEAILKTWQAVMDEFRRSR